MRRIYAILIVLVLACITVARAQSETAPFSVSHVVSTEAVRITLTLPSEVQVSDQSTSEYIKLTVPIPLTTTVNDVTVNDSIVKSIEVKPDDHGMLVLKVSLAKPRKYRVSSFPATGGMPPGLAVEVLKTTYIENSRVLSPAITYIQLEKQSDDRYLAAHILKVNTNDPHVRFRVEPAQGERERVSSMVSRTGAVAGINGGYFMSETRPVGLVKSDGRVISMPVWKRTAVAFPVSGSPVIYNPRGWWQVALPNGTIRDLLDWMDSSTISVPRCGAVVCGATLRQAPANPGGMSVLVRNGQIVALPGNGTSLGRDEYVVHLRGGVVDELKPSLLVGAPIMVSPVLLPDLEGYPHAVGGGPRLLRDGEIAISGKAERFKPDILNGRNARTGLGITRDGQVIMAVVEAPKSYGGGVTLEELAALLRTYGAVQALNLDGGGSSNMAIGDMTVNYPPDIWVRPVASGILVYDDRIGNSSAASVQ